MYKNNVKMLQICIFQDLHFHVLLYSYKLTGRVHNLREPPQGASSDLTYSPSLNIVLDEESRGDDILAEGVDGG